MEDDPKHIRQTVERIYRDESRRVYATLVRLLGEFDLAEEALHDAFRAALEQWPRDGIPANPRAWLVSTGRFKAIDSLRRRSRLEFTDDIAAHAGAAVDSVADADAEEIEDDRLRLIFTCCHPALSADAQTALTLREVCGLTTEEIANAFLTAAPDGGAAHRSRQSQDPRRAHPLSGSVCAGIAGALAKRAARRLPGIQRRLRGVFGRQPDSPRSFQ